jgi:hypothetical protein
VRVDTASEDTHEAQHHDSRGDAVDESGKLAAHWGRGGQIARVEAEIHPDPLRCAARKLSRSCFTGVVESSPGRCLKASGPVNCRVAKLGPAKTFSVTETVKGRHVRVA